MTRIHKIKVSSDFFESVQDGSRRHIVRKVLSNDVSKLYQVGDVLRLIETDNLRIETGRCLDVLVTFIEEEFEFLDMTKNIIIVSFQKKGKINEG